MRLSIGHRIGSMILGAVLAVAVAAGAYVIERRAMAEAQANLDRAADIKLAALDLNRKFLEYRETVGRAVLGGDASLGNIVQSIRQVSAIAAEIAGVSREQSNGLDQINDAIAGMDDLTRRNAALAAE